MKQNEKQNKLAIKTKQTTYNLTPPTVQDKLVNLFEIWIEFLGQPSIEKFIWRVLILEGSFCILFIVITWTKASQAHNLTKIINDNDDDDDNDNDNTNNNRLDRLLLRRGLLVVKQRFPVRRNVAWRYMERGGCVICIVTCRCLGPGEGGWYGMAPSESYRRSLSVG